LPDLFLDSTSAPALDITLSEENNLAGKFFNSKTAQNFLNYYGINFQQDFPDFAHHFGAIDAAGFRIACHYWKSNNTRGTVFILHGYLDHTGLFRHAIRFALSQGFCVCCFDLPGHGLSSGKRAAIESFDTYADVLEVLQQKVQRVLPRPWHGLAQSTGCSVLLNHFWRYEPETYDDIALLAPLVRSRGWRWSKFLFPFLRRLRSAMPRHFNKNSHDPDFLRFLSKEDPLQAFEIPMEWIGAMGEWNANFDQWPVRQKKLLLVQGDEDSTVDWPYNLKAIQEKLPETEVLVMPGLRHQVVNESEEYRRPVFAALEKFWR